ncbi:MAG: hypothetical protein H0X66_03075 [Verrucomicrobia bacterium]|nr:hypothetical protein [Verrucomicrobiota bacterium]
MKHNVNIRSLVTGAVLSALLILTIAAVQEKRTQWEYTTYYRSGSSHLDPDRLSRLGDDGWEAVGFFSFEKTQGFLFKRKK